MTGPRHTRCGAPIRRPWQITVPAWDESAVIGAMLANLLARLDYPHYRVFVGLYPHDPAGLAAVALVVRPTSPAPSPLAAGRDGVEVRRVRG